MKQLIDLEPNDCRYPMNDGGPYLFCAEAQIEGSSYCPFHQALSFRRVREDSRDVENPVLAAIYRKKSQPACLALMDRTEL